MILHHTQIYLLASNHSLCHLFLFKLVLVIEIVDKTIWHKYFPSFDFVDPHTICHTKRNMIKEFLLYLHRHASSKEFEAKRHQPWIANDLSIEWHWLGRKVDSLSIGSFYLDFLKNFLISWIWLTDFAICNCWKTEDKTKIHIFFKEHKTL